MKNVAILEVVNEFEQMGGEKIKEAECLITGRAIEVL